MKLDLGGKSRESGQCPFNRGCPLNRRPKKLMQVLIDKLCNNNKCNLSNVLSHFLHFNS